MGYLDNKKYFITSYYIIQLSQKHNPFNNISVNISVKDKYQLVQKETHQYQELLDLLS